MAVKFSQTDFTQIPWEDIEMVGQWTMLHRDLFNVSWLLGRYCNYSCSYCWPYASTKKKDWRSENVVLLTLEEIKKQARERGFNSFHFSQLGQAQGFQAEATGLASSLGEFHPKH